MSVITYPSKTGIGNTENTLLLIRDASAADYYVSGENVLDGAVTQIPFDTVVRNTAGVTLGNGNTGTYSMAATSVATLDVTSHGFTAADNNKNIWVEFTTGGMVAYSGMLPLTYVNANRITVATGNIATTSGNVSLEYRTIPVPSGFRFVRAKAQVLWMYDATATNPLVSPLWGSLGFWLNGADVNGVSGVDQVCLGPPEWMTYHHTGESALIDVVEGDYLSVVSLLGLTYGNSCYVDGGPATFVEIEFIR